MAGLRRGASDGRVLGHQRAARQAVGAAASLGKTAADLFGAVDAAEQGEIAAQLEKDHDIAASVKARDDWRAKQAISVKALKTYDATVSGLGALAEISSLNGKLDVTQFVASLSAAYTQLTGALSAYGVTLPRGP